MLFYCLQAILGDEGPLPARIYQQVSKEMIGPIVYYVQQFPRYIYPSCLLIKEDLKLVETSELLTNIDYQRAVGNMFAKIHQQEVDVLKTDVQVIRLFFSCSASTSAPTK